MIQILYPQIYKIPKIIFPSLFLFIFFFSISNNTNSFAETNNPLTEIIPLDDTIGLEKTTIQISISKDNKLPWGYVGGKISNPVLEYPVIIQIYDNDKEILGNNIGAIRFAQTPVNEDGTYEYKFRIFDSYQGQTKNFFLGSYTVKIFKVIYLNSNLDEA